MKSITPLANRSDYTWEFFAPLYQELLDQPINNDEELLEWLSCSSKVDVLADEAHFRAYIANACNLLDENIKERFDYMTNIFEPCCEQINEKMHVKILDYPISGFIEKYPERKPFMQKLQKKHSMYRAENIPFETQMQETQNQYSTLMSKMMVLSDEGEEITIQQATKKLRDENRTVRKKYFDKIIEQRLLNTKQCDEIFDILYHLRNMIATNAGYENYVTYIYDEKGRFDYGYADVMSLCKGIELSTKPYLITEQEKRSNKLGIGKLQPFDLSVDIDLKPMLTYGESVDDLLQISESTIKKINPQWINYFESLKSDGNLDLGTRKGKKGGGFHVGLGHSDSSFILMNASENIRDFFVLMHEFGHATHAHLSRKLPNLFLSRYAIEVAEVASMSMECFALEELQGHFNTSDYHRLVRDHCENIIFTLRFVAQYEEFQSLVYAKKDRTNEDRKKIWDDVITQFGTGLVDWSSYEKRRESSRHAHAHVFCSPFYNIEYAFAQLAAVQFWMQYRENKEQALKNYETMLSSGYTKNIPDTYALGGVKFVTEQADIEEILAFVTQIAQENTD